jgi:hypothetical protein
MALIGVSLVAAWHRRSTQFFTLDTDAQAVA